MQGAALSYHGYRFPSDIISHAVWLYHRFCLSFRDAEDLLAQRGIVVTYETIRHWCQTFGPAYARRLRHRRGRMGDTWYLDELFVAIHGRQQYLWRAVDEDGDVIDILVQARRDRHAATRFFRRLLKRQGRTPRRLVTGQAAQLRSGPSHRDAVSCSPHRAVREQPRGGVSPADPPARATDASVQVCRPRAAFSVGARTREESLSCGTSPVTGGSPPLAQDSLLPGVGCGDVCLLKGNGQPDVEGRSRAVLVNLTVPGWGLNLVRLHCR